MKTVLKHYILDHNDLTEFTQRFNISENSTKRLCEYLKYKGEVVNVTETYDVINEWLGFDFVIENDNLSINGYSFKGENVDKFLDNKLS